MIVWLASYPRSGNTLLRTVVHQTMGYPTYSDEVDPEVRRSIAHTGEVEESYGRAELPGPWDAFYAEASASPRVFFVKTHRAPRDAQPAIYVVRDGRPTLASYLRFHREFQPQHGRSMLDLVVGHDYYGDWSGHYREWMAREAGPVLGVRYEELVDATPELVERIARFVGHTQAPRPWSNPFGRMNAQNPRFFAAGETRWTGDAAWTPFVDAAFFHVHGRLMGELGYSTAGEIAESRSRLGDEERELLSTSRRLAATARSLEEVCRERQAVIEDLSRACEERLAVIERLAAAGARADAR